MAKTNGNVGASLCDLCQHFLKTCAKFEAQAGLVQNLATPCQKLNLTDQEETIVAIEIDDVTWPV